MTSALLTAIKHLRSSDEHSIANKHAIGEAIVSFREAVTAEMRKGCEGRTPGLSDAFQGALDRRLTELAHFLALELP